MGFLLLESTLSLTYSGRYCLCAPQKHTFSHSCAYTWTRGSNDGTNQPRELLEGNLQSRGGTDTTELRDDVGEDN
jgi:hypothetical protein